MNENIFKICVVASAVLFTVFFCLTVIPPLIENPDIVAAFAAGFVNPFSSGYAADIIFCWLILAFWVWFEAANKSVKHGWICLLVGVVPGVAVGFAAYLLVRKSQVANSES